MFKVYLSKAGKAASSFLLVLALVFGSLPFGVNVLANNIPISEPGDSLTPPEGYQPQSSQLASPIRDLRVMADEKVFSILLIEDVLPWGASQHHALLQSLGDVKKIPSSIIGGIDLSMFDLVVLSNDQFTSTYQNLVTYQSVIENYVMQGGNVLLGVSDQGWNGGYMQDDYLLGGLVRIHRYEPQNNITDYEHLIVTGELTEGIALTDNDLEWGYASHTSFDETTIPAGGRTILRDAYGSPTLVDYPLGSGHVVASGLTWEHNYIYGGRFAPIALQDLYQYVAFVASDVFFFEISSAIVDITELDEWIDITVSVKNNPGMAGINLEIEFDNRGGHLTPISITKSGEIDTLYSNIDDTSIDWTSTNIVTVVWANAENISNDDELFTIRFAISDNMEYNEAYALSLSGMAVNEEYEELEFSVNTGSIQALMVTTEEVDFYGDVFADTLINIKDAVRLAQYLVDSVEMNRYERMAANVHWDSEDETGKPGSKDENATVKIDVKDAIKLGRYLAGHEGIVLGSVE